MREAFDACLKCTLCVSQCPVMSVDPDFPGPKALGPEWYRQYQAEGVGPVSHVDDCTFCQICESACPVDVPIAHLIAEQKALQKPSLRVRVRNGILARPHWISRMAWMGTLPRPMRRIGKISPGVDLPKQRKSLVQILGEPLAWDMGHVGLFVDCYSRGYDQDLVMRASELLRLWGFAVTRMPRASRCCGAAAFAAGNPRLAKATAHDMFESLAADEGQYDYLVTLNATCDGTIREEWPEYYGIQLNIPIIPFDELAAEAPDAFWERLQSLSKVPGVFVTHTTCRGKVARGDGQLLELAQRAGYANAEPSDAVCCGAAGSYAFKAEHEMVATRLAFRVRHQVQASKAQGIITDSGTCAIHMEQAASVPTRHPAYWLYARYQQYIEGGQHETTTA